MEKLMLEWGIKDENELKHAKKIFDAKEDFIKSTGLTWNQKNEFKWGQGPDRDKMY